MSQKRADQCLPLPFVDVGTMPQGGQEVEFRSSTRSPLSFRGKLFRVSCTKSKKFRSPSCGYPWWLSRRCLHAGGWFTAPPPQCEYEEEETATSAGPRWKASLAVEAVHGAPFVMVCCDRLSKLRFTFFPTGRDHNFHPCWFEARFFLWRQKKLPNYAKPWFDEMETDR